MIQPMPVRAASANLSSRTAVAVSAADMRARSSEAAAMLKVLGNQQRLLVLCRLVEGECSVGELSAGLELSQSALSQHLAVLRTAGVVATRREGLSIRYRLVEGPALALMTTLHAIYCDSGGN